MKGLLLKEWLQVRSELKTMLVIFAVAWALAVLLSLPDLYPILVLTGLIITMSMGFSTTVSDARCGWLAFSAALPVSPGTLVTVKYLSAVLAGLAGLAGSAVLMPIIQLLQGQPLRGSYLIPFLLLELVAVLLLPALTLPVTLLHPELGTFLHPALCGVLVSLMMMVMRSLDRMGILVSVLTAAAVLSFLLLIISWSLSCRVLARRRR